MQTQSIQQLKRPPLTAEEKLRLKEERKSLPRVKVLSADGKQLDPMDHAQVRRSIKRGAGVGVHINGEYFLKLTQLVGEATTLT